MSGEAGDGVVAETVWLQRLWQGSKDRDLQVKEEVAGVNKEAHWHSMNRSSEGRGSCRA